MVVKFDLHCHTNKSDGKNGIWEVIKAASSVGLDVLAITDHNMSSKLLNSNLVYKKYNIKLIPGTEWSFLSGHFLVLGVEPKLMDLKLAEWNIKPRTTKMRIRKGRIKKMLKWAVDNGALVIAAHPGIITGTMSVKKKYLKKLFDQGLIHGAEIHNDDLERRMPKRLYQLWHRSVYQFLKRHEIPAYANNDTHYKNRMGNRYNIIKLNKSEDILEVLKTGKREIEHVGKPHPKRSLRKLIKQTLFG